MMGRTTNSRTTSRDVADLENRMITYGIERNKPPIRNVYEKARG